MLTYAESGVNIDAGNKLIQRIKPLANSTKRLGVMGNIGGFGGLFDLEATGYHDPILVAATDGVGTKLKIAHATGNHASIGIDLVAMCVNDLIVQGAEPLLFLDYFATGKLELPIAETVISGIAEGCKLAGCALLGGETAEMPDMYTDGEYDLAGFAIGAVERHATLPRGDISEGDIIIGLASSGVHSNGYSLIRKIMARDNIPYSYKAPFAPQYNIEQILLTPTKIYVKSCLSAIRTGKVKALAHITGGGITENIPRILPQNTAATIDINSWQLPPIFSWIRKQANLSQPELYKTFNCGIGMILIVAERDLAEITKILTNEGEQVYTIGHIIENSKTEVFYKW